MFRIPKETEMTIPLLQEFLDKHRREVETRYKGLQAAYESDHDILHETAKPAYKPDNRIVVNFPKFMVDTMDGFFIGNPIKVVAEDAAVADRVEYLNRYNSQDDNDAELAKVCSIFGSGFEMYYTDEQAEQCITYLSPVEAFMIYDESIVERPLFFVRRYTDRENHEYGSISDKYGVRNFKVTGGLHWLDDWQPHHFEDVPATEYLENEERQGIFEPVLSMVNAYNKAISEKANDVDYFADAYLKILGVMLDSDDVKQIRDNRIINFEGEDASKLVVEFMNKPNNDTAQENLLDRLERLIFAIGQTANTSDENFGTQSGIAMLYKIWSTSNKGKTKQRKFEKGMDRRFRLLFGHPASKVPADSWMQLQYQFTPNIPRNLLEEAQIAAAMEGIVSKKTQLKVLSIVDDVQTELEAMEEENAAAMMDQMAIMEQAQMNAAEAETEGVADEQPDVLA